MAKKKAAIPKFMKYCGIFQEPPDLSSRKGYSRVAEKRVDGIGSSKSCAEKPKGFR
jgi:hypothetical protein